MLKNKAVLGIFKGACCPVKQILLARILKSSSS
jgi:hypothetical protein